MPHKVLDKIKKKFNFVIINTSQTMPGEILSLIEIMPFLEDNAILVFPNIISHLKNVYIKDIDKTLLKKTGRKKLFMIKIKRWEILVLFS